MRCEHEDEAVVDGVCECGQRVQYGVRWSDLSESWEFSGSTSRERSRAVIEEWSSPRHPLTLIKREVDYLGHPVAAR